MPTVRLAVSSLAFLLAASTLAACGSDAPSFTLADDAPELEELLAQVTTLPPTTVPAGGSAEDDTPRPADPVPERRPCRSALELADVLPPGIVQLEPVPVPPPPAEVLTRVDLVEPYLTLIFDVEQDPAPVPALLAVLRSHGIRTNFFVPANWAEDNPALIAALLEAGHDIGNHSYAHERMAGWDALDIAADLDRAEQALMGLGVPSTRPWHRPPYGSRSGVSVATAFELGWTTVTPTTGADDSIPGTPAEVQDAICADLLEAAEHGAILVSHTFNPETPAAVDRFVREMHDLGFVFVSLSVLTADDPAQFVVELDLD